jgi:hypothetical protein
VSELPRTSPQSREQVINMYFLEHRAKLLDVAAFLDRIDRAQPGTASSDFREAALKRAIGLLIDGQPQRAKRVLELLSDTTAEMPQSAHGMKGASGAVKTATGGGE